MKESVLQRCERITSLFNNGGGGGGAVSSVNGRTGDVVVVNKVNGNTGDVEVVSSVNGESGDVTVVTCNPFPEGTVTGIGVTGGVQTIDFCNSLANNPSVVTGMMYLGPVYLAEGAKDPWVYPYGRILADGGEVTVKVLKCTRSTNHVNIVMVLEMTSTNQGPRHWMTIYEKDGSTTDASVKGQLMFGSDSYPWFGMLYSPLDNSSTNPLVDRFVAASRADVKVKDFGTTGSGNVVTNVNVNSSGKLEVTKGNLTVPSAASSSEITTGTATDKFISPSTNEEAVKTGILANANKTPLESANQKLVQTWLGTTELTFTFADNTTRTFNFVCNEILPTQS